VQPVDHLLTMQLRVLKAAREALVEPILSEDVELYTQLFKYENSPSQRAILRDMHRIKWLCMHWTILDEVCSERCLRKHVRHNFARVFLFLQGRLCHEAHCRHSEGVDITTRLLEHQRCLAEELLYAGTRADRAYRRLCYSVERQSRRIERMIHQIGNER